MEYARHKDTGNTAFKAGNWRAASAAYLLAADAAETPAERAVARANLSAATLKDGRPDEAAQHAAEAAREDPTYGKAFFRKGQALLQVGRAQGDIHALLLAQEALCEASRLSKASDAALVKLVGEARDAACHKARLRGPVEVCRTGTHGVGMRALRDVSAGETLLEDMPVAFSKKTHWQEAAQDIVKSLKALDKDDLRWVLRLHDPAGDGASLEEKLYCIWDANGHSVGEIDFRIDEFQKAGCAIYLTGSRVNHSCRPNAVQSFCPTTGKIRFRSIGPIKRGEEVTITYSPLHLGREARHAKLKFACVCPRCEAEAAAPAPAEDVAAAAAAIEAEYEEISGLSLRASEKNDPNVRDEAAVRADALEQRAVAELGEAHAATYMACMLKCKLWAERKGVLPSLERLHRLAMMKMPPNFPVFVSTNMYIAMHKVDCDDEEVVGHLNKAFKVHVTAVGPSMDNEKDDIENFWARYSTELTHLEIDSLERCRMLFIKS